MSNALAIAAVTNYLRILLHNRLGDDVPGVDVSTRPPDRARNGDTGEQVNLFLYHTAINAAWRNRDIPWRVRPGEVGHPPLPLNLYYLLTAYSGEDEAGVPQDPNPPQLLGSYRLLGQAMGILHDHPLLDPTQINSALPDADQDAFPFDQVEKVRISPQPLNLEEMSKIWSGFQTHYRPSVAYEVSVVLIESQRPRRAALPVLRRGPEDRGVETVIGPFPILEEIRRPAGARYGFQLGDTVELIGRNLAGENLAVGLTHPLLLPVELSPQPDSTAEKLIVALPDNGTAVNWAAGFYTLTVTSGATGETARRSNALPLPLSPQVTDISPNPATPDGSGSVTLTVQCAPRVLPAQRARLLLGEREIPAQDHPAPTDSLTFTITDAPLGAFVVRLRVDGVDSLPVQATPAGLIFDPAQTVTIEA
jgi:hypothetical protein